jgi:hypothetical protein
MSKSRDSAVPGLRMKRLLPTNDSELVEAIETLDEETMLTACSLLLSDRDYEDKERSEMSDQEEESDASKLWSIFVRCKDATRIIERHPSSHISKVENGAAPTFLNPLIPLANPPSQIQQQHGIMIPPKVTTSAGSTRISSVTTMKAMKSQQPIHTMNPPPTRRSSFSQQKPRTTGSTTLAGGTMNSTATATSAIGRGRVGGILTGGNTTTTTTTNSSTISATISRQQPPPHLKRENSDDSSSLASLSSQKSVSSSKKGGRDNTSSKATPSVSNPPPEVLHFLQALNSQSTATATTATAKSLSIITTRSMEHGEAKKEKSRQEKTSPSETPSEPRRLRKRG